MKKILIAFGTRPEAIKLAPVIKQMIKSQKLEPIICSTDQHDDLLSSVLQTFDIEPNYRLNIFKKNQTPATIIADVILKATEIIPLDSLDMIIIQGDTSSALGMALFAFNNHIPVGHVEAGLRTHNMYSPFPEEMNRIVIDRISTLCFAPTSHAVKNLLSENVPRETVIITHGNTIVDAVFMAKKMMKEKKYTSLGETILITAHRRENFGKGIAGICQGIKKLAEKYTNINFVFPVHPNPNIIIPVMKTISSIKNIFITASLSYTDFIEVLSGCTLIMTDSGGVQEEAMSFKKPVFILRNETERVEIVEMGSGKIVGTDPDVIFKEVSNVLDSSTQYKKMTRASTRYGDGYASNRIVREIERYFENDTK